MAKSYTGRGDNGTTARFGGKRISKASPLPRVMGALDEANAALGLAATLTEDREIILRIEELQHVLFRVGADVATPLDHHAPKARRINKEDTINLENLTDTLDAELPELRNFILPGGTPAASALHLARTIARRAERELNSLVDSEEPLNTNIKPFINRLSSYLFALARYANFRANKDDRRPQYE